MITLISRIVSRFVDVTARRPAGFVGRYMYRQPAGHEQSFALVMEWLGPIEGRRCLEIGSGGGVLIERALAAGASSVAALDHSADMLTLAMIRNADALAADRLTVKLGDAATIPWADLAFDAVWTANVFFFLADPAAVLAEIFRVLRPGGCLVIATVPAPLPPPSLTQWWVVLVGPTMHLHTDDALRRLVEAAGFTDVSVKSEYGVQMCRAVRPTA